MELFLRRINAAAFLNGSEMAELAATCSDVIVVNPKTELVSEGDAPEHLHVLLEGWAMRSLALPDGKRQIPALFVPGDVMDLDALGTERLGYGLSTLSRCRIALLSRAGLRSAMQRGPGLAGAFLALALQENQVLMRRNVSLGGQSARERLAHLLCELVARWRGAGVALRSGQLSFPLTQADLADVLGLSTVHVNRVLQGLRADGLIRLRGVEFEVVDWDGLADAGEFQAGYLGLGASGASSTRGDLFVRNKRQRAELIPSQA